MAALSSSSEQKPGDGMNRRKARGLKTTPADVHNYDDNTACHDNSHTIDDDKKRLDGDRHRADDDNNKCDGHSHEVGDDNSILNDIEIKLLRSGTPKTNSKEDPSKMETGTGNKTMTFNVGGTIFQTRVTTLKETACKLADRDWLSECYDDRRDEYFFDRDPEVFRCVLNFLRSGHLHIPSHMCGPHVKEELEYWGVSPRHIQPCCWSTFSSWTSTEESLRQLEVDIKLRAPSYLLQHRSKCGHFRVKVWRTLTNPAFSTLATIYGWISVVFVLVAIFSFCASTHPTFRVPSRTVIQSMTSPSRDNVTTSTTQPHLQTNVTSTHVIAENVTKVPSGYKTVEERLAETEVHDALFYLDIICFFFFLTELVTKLVCSPRKLRYLKSFNGVIDVVAVVPDLVELVLLAALGYQAVTGGSVLSLLSFLRVMRVFRIFRLFRHIPGLWIMVYTLRASYRDLFLMLAFLLVGTVFFASLIFFVDDKETFTSIPHGFWWALVTMTTVGYGDMYPVTPLGYVLGAVTAVCGVLMIGFTIPALVNNFILYYQHVQFALEKEQLGRQLAQEKAAKEEERKKKEEEEGEERDKGEREEREDDRREGNEENNENGTGAATGNGKNGQETRTEGVPVQSFVVDDVENIPLVTFGQASTKL